MKIVDTTLLTDFHPLVYAMQAFYETSLGCPVQIVIEDQEDMRQFKRFLISKDIQFREIYEGKMMSLEFVRD